MGPSTDANSAWVVQEIQRSYATKVDAVTFDPTTMEVTDRVDFADYGLAAKLARWGIDLHMGSLSGMANQVVLFVLAIGIAAMVVWGYAVVGNRRHRRRGNRHWNIPAAGGDQPRRVPHHRCGPRRLGATTRTSDGLIPAKPRCPTCPRHSPSGVGHRVRCGALGDGKDDDAA
ncbi:PepSY domain-containing protein [Brevibacterium linens]|uniref:PepSY domain-containing protein n=1 Tax=Brevibacterium linens TaxID=1703 RepID=UPI003F8B1568